MVCYPIKMTALSALDLTAVCLWLLLWVGYPYFAGLLSHNRPNLLAYTHPYRQQWMQNALGRENRIADAALVGNLMQTSTFFSSTTVLILGALLALLGSIDEGLRIVASLPLAEQQTASHVEIKALVLLGIFVHALVRFTWALRQFNVVNILVGAMPSHGERMHDQRAVLNADQAARLVELAGENFSHGVRSYYYAVPVLLWFVNAWLLLGTALLMTLLLYWMDFRSATVRALSESEHSNE
jgi:uncharacterized membrane protein